MCIRTIDRPKNRAPVARIDLTIFSTKNSCLQAVILVQTAPSPVWTHVHIPAIDRPACRQSTLVAFCGLSSANVRQCHTFTGYASHILAQPCATSPQSDT